jgi:hypothetical protein
MFLKPSVFSSNYRCEQLFSLMKDTKSRTKTRLTDEHLEGCMQIATTEIGSDIEMLRNENRCQIFH